MKGPQHGLTPGHPIEVAHKTLAIEQKLQKYRDEEVRLQQHAAAEAQKKQEQYQGWLQGRRADCLNKLRKQHQFFKDQDRRIYAFWKSTETVKNQRVEKERTFKAQVSLQARTSHDQQEATREATYK
jgi:hypothetical protein